MSACEHFIIGAGVMFGLLVHQALSLGIGQSQVSNDQMTTVKPCEVGKFSDNLETRLLSVEQRTSLRRPQDDGQAASDPEPTLS